MAVSFGDFAFDPERRQLLRLGEPVALETKAYELLGLLLSRRPNALSKTQIRAVLWPGTFVSESALARLVSQLRAACRDSAKTPRYIRTLHGFGYAFCGDAEEVRGASRAFVPHGQLRLFLDGREIALREGENVLGRVDDAVGWLESPTVSRRHARIVVADGKATLEDLGSKNGTFLREKRLTAPAALADGDEIRLGRVRMTFRILVPPSTRTEAGD